MQCNEIQHNVLFFFLLHNGISKRYAMQYNSTLCDISNAQRNELALVCIVMQWIELVLVCNAMQLSMFFLQSTTDEVN